MDRSLLLKRRMGRLASPPHRAPPLANRQPVARATRVIEPGHAPREARVAGRPRRCRQVNGRERHPGSARSDEPRSPRPATHAGSIGPFLVSCGRALTAPNDGLRRWMTLPIHKDRECRGRFDPPSIVLFPAELSRTARLLSSLVSGLTGRVLCDERARRLRAAPGSRGPGRRREQGGGAGGEAGECVGMARRLRSRVWR